MRFPAIACLFVSGLAYADVDKDLARRGRVEIAHVGDLIVLKLPDATGDLASLRRGPFTCRSEAVGWQGENVVQCYVGLTRSGRLVRTLVREIHAYVGTTQIESDPRGLTIAIFDAWTLAIWTNCHDRRGDMRCDGGVDFDNRPLIATLSLKR